MAAKEGSEGVMAMGNFVQEVNISLFTKFHPESEKKNILVHGTHWPYLGSQNPYILDRTKNIRKCVGNFSFSLVLKWLNLMILESRKNIGKKTENKGKK